MAPRMGPSRPPALHTSFPASEPCVEKINQVAAVARGSGCCAVATPPPQGERCKLSGAASALFPHGAHSDECPRMPAWCSPRAFAVLVRISSDVCCCGDSFAKATVTGGSSSRHGQGRAAGAGGDEPSNRRQRTFVARKYAFAYVLN